MNSVKRQLTPQKCVNNSSPKKQKLFDEKLLDLFNDSNDFEFAALDAASRKEQIGLDASADFDFSVLDAACRRAENGVDLSNWRRCIVVQVERQQPSFDLVMHVRAEGSVDKENEQATMTCCHLQGPWSQTNVEVGDLLSVKAEWNEQLSAYKVDRDQGFCVTHPDTLIPATSVVGSLFCRRKAVLSDRFRGIDAASKVMVIGTVVHEVLQTVLRKGLTTLEEIEATSAELLNSRQMTYTLYSSLMTRDEIDMEVRKFLPNIFDFVEQYVVGKEHNTELRNVDFGDKIAQIQDIEENLWIPQLGLRGRIDVSVRVQRRRKHLKVATSNEEQILPLELKTGRATFSMEHKGQLILYQMMLSTIGRDTQSGLLLYLREGVLREIQGARNEQRDLLILRNDLANFLCRSSPVTADLAAFTINENGKLPQSFQLPEPISHHSACKSCAYASICCSFAQTDSSLVLSDNHPLRQSMHEATGHLVMEDYAYFIRWCGLLALEEQEARRSNSMRPLWTETPNTRQSQGRALVGLKLHGDGILMEDSRYLHTFHVSLAGAADCPDLSMSGFFVSEYVVVSTSQRLAVASGFISDIDKSNIAITLERNLQQNYKDAFFIVDKHESQSGNAFNYTNLGMLLQKEARFDTLRDIIVRRQAPTFRKSLPKVVITEGAAIVKQLNVDQRAAVLKALTTESYMLIKGLPGTGKTQTLVAIVQLLLLMRKTVLITSHTHSAVDNLLLRLTGVHLLRLGSSGRLHPQLLEYGEAAATKDCTNEVDLARAYGAYNVVGVTCLGMGHSLFLHRKFDVCIVDEATQVLQPTILRPLFFADRFILVGDPEQLPPLVRSREARAAGADESLFQRLDCKEATSVLTLQYRMNKTINKLANDFAYTSTLHCATTTVETATLQLPISAVCKEKWLQRVLQRHLELAVFLLDTLDCAGRSLAFADSLLENQRVTEEVSQLPPIKESHSKRRAQRFNRYTNYCDAAVVLHILRALLSAGYNAESIGIIAPYRAQVDMLRKLLTLSHTHCKDQESALQFAHVEVNTVDQYQGRDKDIIIYSGCKTGSPTDSDSERVPDAEILDDKRRLTVAITRAKMKLILVGDVMRLQQYAPFRSLFTHIRGLCKLRLEDGKHGFQWQPLLEELSDLMKTD